MKGIMMIEPLVMQTVKGLKTQTRRSGLLNKTINLDPDNWDYSRFWDGHAKFTEKHNALHEHYVRARYQVGDKVFIKEPYVDLPNGNVLYQYFSPKGHRMFPGAYKNKMFMPEKYARMYIEITGVRVERLADISNEDAISEGIEKISPHSTRWKDYATNESRSHGFKNPRFSFFSLYNFANGKKKFEPVANIWVFVYEYKFVENKIK